MARTHQTRKRSLPQSGRKTFKRRRFVRRRTKKTTNWTSQSGRGGGITFGRKRTSRRQWKNLLWNSSISQTHYRSNNSTAFTSGTPTTPASMFVSLTSARRFSGNPFWTTLGGGVNPDGGAMPTFAVNSDFTIRGGMYGLRISNVPDAADVDKDALTVTVYLLWTTKNFNPGLTPSGAVSTGWDPTLIADFQTNVGRVMLKKTFLVNEGDVFTVEKRMRLQKIDQTEYNALYSEPVWMIAVGNTSASTSKTIGITAYYNLSFVGDAI